LGKFILRTLVFLVFLGCTLESIFWFILPASQHPRLQFDETFQITHFDPSWMSSGTRTFGRFCYRQGKWTINQAGWNSQIEYNPEKQNGRLRIAVLGDSYVAGFAVDTENHLDAQLSGLCGSQAEVLAFGAPGATFGQSIGIARYVEATYDPDIFLVFVGNGAIRNSLGRNGPFSFGVFSGDNGFVLSPPEHIYRPSRIGRLVYRSALVRYLTMNRQFRVENSLEGVMGLDEAQALANQEIDPGDLKLASFLVEEMVRALPGDRIIFFTDAPRGLLYKSANLPPQTFDFRLLKDSIEGYPNVDLLGLSQAMWEDYAQNGKPFETPFDPHWNDRGHLIAAQALFGKIGGMLPAGQPGESP